MSYCQNCSNWVNKGVYCYSCREKHKRITKDSHKMISYSIKNPKPIPRRKTVYLRKILDWLLKVKKLNIESVEQTNSSITKVKNLITLIHLPMRNQRFDAKSEHHYDILHINFQNLEYDLKHNLNYIHGSENLLHETLRIFQNCIRYIYCLESQEPLSFVPFSIELDTLLLLHTCNKTCLYTFSVLPSPSLCYLDNIFFSFLSFLPYAFHNILSDILKAFLCFSDNTLDYNSDVLSYSIQFLLFNEYFDNYSNKYFCSTQIHTLYIPDWSNSQ